MSSKHLIDPAAEHAGQAVYGRRVLRVYDAFVLGFSNRFAWRCPSGELLAHYDAHVSANHLDVGVGTGWFLDRCRFPSPTPRLVLLDLNPTCLETAARRVARYEPECIQASVLRPIRYEGPRFDSVALNYVLHCLPGSMSEKAVVFDHLLPLMNPGAVLFGSTILGRGVPHNWIARRLMRTYNRRGIFHNEHDCEKTLHGLLDRRFGGVRTSIAGSVCRYSATPGDSTKTPDARDCH